MPTEFFLTTNPALLAQYCKLRQRVYRKHYPHLAEDFGCADLVDHRSYIVVGYDQRVVAGGRITIARPECPQPLPMEEAGFSLAAALPQFEFDRRPYAEFSRVAVDPAYAGGRRCSFGLIQKLAETAARFGIDLVFSICPSPQVRWNSLNSRWCGVAFQTFPEIEIPTPFCIPMTLCAYTGLVAAYRGILGLAA